MNIIDTIREAPDDAQFFLVRELPNIGKTVQSYGNDNTIKRLKALAESHERLLTAAMAVEGDMQGASTELAVRVEFSQAIEQAEKLQ